MLDGDHHFTGPSASLKLLLLGELHFRFPAQIWQAETYRRLVTKINATEERPPRCAVCMDLAVDHQQPRAPVELPRRIDMISHHMRTK